MNEQLILKLAEQASMDFSDFEQDTVDLDELKKFAELIVKKFDDILVLEHLDCVGNQDKQAAQRIDRLREKVKTHFGVEE
jgi:hypothetical protein